MNRWCERFNAAHDRTLARCASLEVKLVAANAEIARLREAAAKAHRKAEAGEHEVLEDEGGEGGEDEEKENTLVVPSTPVHRQLAAVRRESRESVKRNCKSLVADKREGELTYSRPRVQESAVAPGAHAQLALFVQPVTTSWMLKLNLYLLDLLTA